MGSPGVEVQDRIPVTKKEAVTLCYDCRVIRVCCDIYDTLVASNLDTLDFESILLVYGLV